MIERGQERDTVGERGRQKERHKGRRGENRLCLWLPAPLPRKAVLVFKAHREVIGGKDGKIPCHIFLHCHPYKSDLDAHSSFINMVFSVPLAKKKKDLTKPPSISLQMGIVILHDYVLCICAQQYCLYTFL